MLLRQMNQNMGKFHDDRLGFSWNFNHSVLISNWEKPGNFSSQAITVLEIWVLKFWVILPTLNFEKKCTFKDQQVSKKTPSPIVSKTKLKKLKLGLIHHYESQKVQNFKTVIFFLNFWAPYSPLWNELVIDNIFFW